MKLLILGGTLFLGRHVTEAALARGHEVTLFNRGRTGPELYPGVERIHGDRKTDLDRLEGRHWDAMVDTCGYLPRDVRASGTALRDACDHYTYISSISVYEAPVRPGSDEEAPLAEIDEALAEELTPDSYGPLKALCERAIEQIMPGRTLIVRAGLLVGPHDPTRRFCYWVRRIAEGGEVLAPGSPTRGVQFIDARDVAEWIIDMAGRRTTGSYNVTGPAESLSMGSLLERIASVTGSGARPTWVDEGFLLERGVAPWTDLPIWLPGDANGILKIDIGRALASGLNIRPLEDTIRDVLDCQMISALGAEEPLAIEPPKGGGISRVREIELLEEWSRRAEQING